MKTDFDFRNCLNLTLLVLKNLINSIKQWELKDLLTGFGPLSVWLLCFTFSRYIPSDIRPTIHLHLLPDIEQALFGIPFIYELLPNSPLITLLSSIPYLLHFALPWPFAIYLWRVEGKNLAFLFLWVIGVLNLIGLITQILLPTAPPWYIDKFGYEEASYDMSSDPGRLIDIDELFGISLFKNMYGTNPVVFGSFPSLHAAWPFTIAMYSSNKILGRWKWIYVVWVWWAAIYLHHHFIIDVLGGIGFSLFVLYLARPSYETETAKQHRVRLVLCV